MVEQNLTRPKDDLWSYLSRPCQIVVVWDDRTTANMDPCKENSERMQNDFSCQYKKRFSLLAKSLGQYNFS